MKGIPEDEIDENFDEETWFKKLYDPDINIVFDFIVPEGWKVFKAFLQVYL
jgi:hypothetical protein